MRTLVARAVRAIDRLRRRIHQRPWSASTCERRMRARTNGAYGCANPREHLFH